MRSFPPEPHKRYPRVVYRSIPTMRVDSRRPEFGPLEPGSENEPTRATSIAHTCAC